MEEDLNLEIPKIDLPDITLPNLDFPILSFPDFSALYNTRSKKKRKKPSWKRKYRVSFRKR